MENNILSEHIVGNGSKEFKEKLDKFLSRNVVIGSVHYAVTPIITPDNLKGAPSKGMIFSCLIFYTLNQ